MMSRPVTATVQALLMLALALTVFTQAVALPWVSGEFAASYPEVEELRWPMLTVAIAGLICFDAILVSTWILVGAVQKGKIFSVRSLRWVDVIIWSLGAATLLSLGTFIFLIMASLGPITVPATGMVVSLALATATLLAMTLRALLIQATTLKTEMDEVI